MRIFALTLILMILSSVGVRAQSLETYEGTRNWEFNITPGLNNDGEQIDFGIAHFPIQYFGFKVQLGFASEIEELADWMDDDYDYDADYTIRFKSTFSIVLRSPKILKWKRYDGSFYLFAEPGIILSPGASGSHDAKTFNKDLKTGINLQIDRCVFSIGFGISDYSLYSGYPTNHWGDPERDNYTTYSGFLGFALKF